LPPKTVACVASPAVASGYTDEPSIEVSKQAAIEFADPADPGGVLAGEPSFSMFQAAMLSVRVRGRAAFAVIPGGAQVIQAAEQIGDIVEAERLYRLLMKSDPTDASAPFNLGNMLRAAARTVEAEAALRAATRANPAFAEAWYNLADLLDDQGRSDAAAECLRKAIIVAPDYIDAMFNLALLLQRKGIYPEAADHWRRYLANDPSSEWASRARRSLKFCESRRTFSQAPRNPRIRIKLPN
jgi:tetratricopeptide (TPR) repeat protein